MKKQTLYKVAGGTAAVVTVAAPTIGVVYLTKDWHYHNPVTEAKTQLERIFDEKIGNSKSTYLTEKIVNPIGGSDLSSDFIILDSNWMDDAHIKGMIAKDANGNEIDLTKQIINPSSPVRLTEDKITGDFKFTKEELDKLKAGTIDIQMADYTVLSEVEEKLLHVNELLRAYKAELDRQGQHRKIGVYTFPDLNRRSITVKVYELNDFSNEDLDVINDFTGRVKLPTDINDSRVQWYRNYREHQGNDQWNNNNEWLQMFGGEHFLIADYHLENWYHLLKTQDNTPEQDRKNAAMAQIGISIDKDMIKVADKVEGHEHTDPNTIFLNNRIFNSGGHEFHNLRRFVEKNMIVTHKPVLDLQTNQFKIVWTFYKFDDTTSFTQGNTERAFNPTNIHVVVDSMPLDFLGDTTHQINKTPANRDKFRMMLTQTGHNTFQDWINQPLTGPGLEILGSVMPALKAPASQMIDVWKKMAALYEDPSRRDVLITKILGDDGVDKIFDAIQNSSNINASEFWKIGFEDFPGPADHPEQGELVTLWSNLDKLQGLDKHGLYKLYNLVTGFKIIGDYLNKRINEEFPNFELPTAEGSSISELIFQLQQHNIIPNTFRVDDILSDPKNALKTILDGLLTHDFTLDKDYSKILLGLAAQYLKLDQNQQDKMEGPLANLISKPNGIKQLVKLILGTHTSQELLDAIFGGNYLKIVEFIATNGKDNAHQVDYSLIKSIAQVAQASGIIPGSLSSIIPDTDSSAQMVANIFNKGGITSLFGLVEDLLTKGVGHTDATEFASTLEKVRDAVKPTQQIIDLMNVFQGVNSPLDLIGVIAEIKGKLSTFKNWGDFKAMLSLVESKIDPHTTITFGNNGETIYQFIHKLNTLAHGVQLADSEDLMGILGGITDLSGNGAKFVQTLIGTIIYLGGNGIDHTGDQSYPLIKTLAGMFTSGIDWNSLNGELPMALDALFAGYDYDINPSNPAASGRSRIYQESVTVSNVDGTPVLDALGNSVSKSLRDDYTGVDSFVNHIFEQAKIAGMNIDGYKSQITSSKDYMGNFFDGTADAQGKSTLQKLIESIGSGAGNTVSEIAQYLSDAAIASTFQTLLEPFQKGFLGSTAADGTVVSKTISVDLIKNILDAVKMFVPSLSSLDSTQVASFVYTFLDSGLSGVPAAEQSALLSQIAGMLPNSIKSILTPELINGLLHGFKTQAEFETTMKAAIPSIWDVRVTTTIDVPIFGKTNVDLSLSALLTKLYNHQITSAYAIAHGGGAGLLPNIVTAKVNDLSIFLQKGLFGITSDDLPKVVTSLKSLFKDLDAFFNWKLASYSIISYLPESIKPIVPVVTEIKNVMSKFGDELPKAISLIQKLVKDGVDTFDSNSLNDLISAAKTIISKMKEVIPSIASSDIVIKVETALSSLTNHGETLHNLLHNGFGGTTTDNMRISEVIISVLKTFVPGIPSMIVDYIPKLLVGQDNIDHIKTDAIAELAKYVIPDEVRYEGSDLFKPQISSGAYAGLKSEADKLIAEVKDQNRSVSDTLDSLSKLRVQYDAIVAYNAKIAKANADDKRYVVAMAEFTKEQSKFVNVTGTYSPSVVSAEIKGHELNDAELTKFGITGITLDHTKYDYSYDLTAVNGDGKVKMTIHITSKDETLISQKQQSYSRDIEVQVSGLQAKIEAEKARLQQFIADISQHMPTLVSTIDPATTKIGYLDKETSFVLPSLENAIVKITKIDMGGTDKTQALLSIEVSSTLMGVKLTATTSSPVAMSETFAPTLKPTPAEFISGLKNELATNHITWTPAKNSWDNGMGGSTNSKLADVFKTYFAAEFAGTAMTLDPSDLFLNNKSYLLSVLFDKQNDGKTSFASFTHVGIGLTSSAPAHMARIDAFLKTLD